MRLNLTKSLLSLYLTAGITSADWGDSVYELTEADDTGEILEEDAMIFVLYQDKSHDDNNAFL